MRDLSALLFLAAIILAVPAFLMRGSRERRYLCRVLVYVALGVWMSIDAGQEHDWFRWPLFGLAAMWWLTAMRTWRKLETVRGQSDDRP